MRLCFVPSKVRAEKDFQKTLKTMVEHGYVLAMRLIGAWNARSLLSTVEKQFAKEPNGFMFTVPKGMW